MFSGTAVSDAKSAPLPELSQRVLQVQGVTLVWMAVEGAIGLGTAWSSRSPALFAFGGDSLIELLSAAVVYWRFRFALNEARAARIAGALLFALAALVVIACVLSFLGYYEAKPSLLGIVLLAAAAVVMPWLARRKRQLADVTSIPSPRAHSPQSALSGYMPWCAF